ncbi:MAG: NADPH-dependent assimilatory sulfite reductase hemoprotein subunit [Opitutales bacterium]|jgi:sulfite reductase (NADPH) hemoprotein beta-component|nr:NADPH-dependent assimilatory sulfite reductase hemoprotein subunit [Opitutales bacterium]MBT6769067.1 NADPH-dependent assimilatory sulfite reductase hemoprotein subunit [Opitutales bacterium]
MKSENPVVTPPVISHEPKKLVKNEALKESSDYLRGGLLDGLKDTSTGALSRNDTLLSKFHGIYQQDDRDVRKKLRRQKHEPAYSFMIRVRAPGGMCSTDQWLAMDRIAATYANPSLKLTTRQAIQFHGVIKTNLKASIQKINHALMDTLAACGDVNRNVMCCPNPHDPGIHAEVLQATRDISERLTPKTNAYHDIWLTDQSGENIKITHDAEPIYGKTYLPRKFKIVIAIPPSNDVDVYAHDLGFIAIVKEGTLQGYNVTAGGGMAMSHGNERTYPRLARLIGFCKPDQIVDVAEAVVTVQRDYGDRSNRKHARLKYTIDDYGIDWFRDETESRLGYQLAPIQEFTFENSQDRYGWVEGEDGHRHLTLFIQNGRVRDDGGSSLRTALREIARIHKGHFRLTPNQNLIVANVRENDRISIESILEHHRVVAAQNHSALRLNSMSCVALPTCSLALAESERVIPQLIAELERILEIHDLEKEAITLRMTGCPNGCARPHLAEIGIVGRAPGKYNLYLGGGFHGDRLGTLFKESLTLEEITDQLDPILGTYKDERQPDERFGDFCLRTKIVV